VSGFDELVAEADRAPIDGWDFTWLDGRAEEARPSWKYFDRVCERAGNAPSVLEVQAGVGSMVAMLPSRPRLAVATEGFPPSIAIAAPRLRSCRVHRVVTSQTHQVLPFTADVFDLVISRHPIQVWWSEIARVLRPGGTYFAQHVGPHSLQSLSEFFMGPLPDSSMRDVEVERQAAERSGLVVTRMDLEHPRTVFYDVGAVVYFLRLVPWIVPGFTVEKYRERLRDLHSLLERDGGFESAASRTLVEAKKRV
jgi:SAM-dependent methyltransferase